MKKVLSIAVALFLLSGIACGDGNTGTLAMFNWVYALPAVQEAEAAAEESLDITSLILASAEETVVPPYFALAIAVEENRTLDPLAVSKQNADGSYDYGLFQISSRYMDYFIRKYWDKGYAFNWRDPYDNAYLACKIIGCLISREKTNTYWAVAVCYNAGYSRLENPPDATIEYAVRVMERWGELSGAEYINPLIREGV